MEEYVVSMPHQQFLDTFFKGYHSLDPVKVVAIRTTLNKELAIKSGMEETTMHPPLVHLHHAKHLWSYY